MQEQKDATSSSDWKEFTAPDGRKYYYNKTTKESRWSMPDEMKQAKDASTARASPNPAAGSVQVRDYVLFPPPLSNANST